MKEEGVELKKKKKELKILLQEYKCSNLQEIKQKHVVRRNIMWGSIQMK